MGIAEDIRFGVVSTKDLMEAVHRFRYKVYVEECGFEAADDHPQGLETDLWDSRAIHIAALEAQGEVAGTIRLILDSDLDLPALKAIASYYEKPVDVARAAEVSRFAVAKLYRQAAENRADIELDPETPTAYVFHREGENDPPSQRRRRRFAIILGLFQMVFRVSHRLGARNWYMMAEKPLWYFLRRYQILTQAIGPEMDYHGPRSPYILNVHTAESHLVRENPHLGRSFADSLALPIPILEGTGAPLEFPVTGLGFKDLLTPARPGRPADARPT